MRLLTSSLLFGAASAAVSPQQQVLQPSPDGSEVRTNPRYDLEESLKSLNGEARAVWDEVAAMFPKAMDMTSFVSQPKKHSRRPDNHWDHIVKGSDVQGVWVKNQNGEAERDVDGKLEPYTLRSRKVDPSSLGVDPGVQQYSGYLDDEDDDKHLFYCKSF